MSDNNVELYKILLDAYYKECELFYTKANNFITLQLALFGAVIAGFEKLIHFQFVFRVAFSMLIIVSFLQLLISKRGFDVLDAMIRVLGKFESKNNFNYLNDISNIIKSKRKYITIKKMNFPSFAIVILNCCFTLLWTVLWLFIEFM